MTRWRHRGGWVVAGIAVVVAACALPGRAQESPAEAVPAAAESTVAPTAAEPTTAPPEADPTASPAPSEAPATTAPTPTAPLPLDLQPYRVLVALGVARGSELPPGFESALAAELTRGIVTRVGALWQADVTPVAWLQPGNRAVLEGFSESALNDRFLPTDYDKVLLGTIEAEGAGYRISAREWDRNSQTATAVSSRLEFEARIVPDRLFAELLSHFRPIAKVEQVSEDGKTISFVVRGGELLPPDAGLAPARAGMYLAPYFRYYDRQKELKKLQPLEWTYVKVTAVDRGRLTGQLVSAFPNPLSGSRRRVDLMAIAVSPRYDATEITLVPRGQADNPLAGTRVDVMNREPTDDDKVEDRLVLHTSRDGTIRVPANRELPLQYLYVLSGKSVLATVPYIAGNARTARLEVPDDGPRLRVEGEVAIMEAELIELVARREVTIARALGLAKAKDWDAADRLVEEVKKLPTKEQLLARVEAIRLPAVNASRVTKNRVGESRINKLCQTLVEHIERHLNPDRIRDFLQEYRELKDIG